MEASVRHSFSFPVQRSCVPSLFFPTVLSSSLSYPRSPLLVGFHLVILFLSSSFVVRPTHGQYIIGSYLYNQTYAEGNSLLTAQLRDHPDLENIFYPNKYRLPRDFYVYQPPNRDTEYTQNVILNPCSNYEYDCCFDTYGTPEYSYVENNASLATYGTRSTLNDDGDVMDIDTSRRPDDELFIDESCEGENLPLGRTDCVMSRVARRSFSLLPRCWNVNDSVIADANCRSPADGTPLPLCLEVAVTQTAFILECGGDFATNEHCGTYLEIHRPARADKLSEVRLRAMYSSGYRMTVISTSYKGDSGRTICYDPIKKGAYEIWWVMRTLYNFIVERRIPFKVVSPECDWDPENNRFLPYATLYNTDGTRKARSLAGLNPFDPMKLLFTRPRIEGKNTNPGIGMGSTYIPTDGTTYHSTARWDEATWHNVYTYTYTPDKPDYTVRRGKIEPSFDEQAALADLVRRRGYRRLQDVPEHELDAIYIELEYYTPEKELLKKNKRRTAEIELFSSDSSSSVSSEDEKGGETGETEEDRDNWEKYSEEEEKEEQQYESSVPLSFERNNRLRNVDDNGEKKGPSSVSSVEKDTFSLPRRTVVDYSNAEGLVHPIRNEGG